MGITDPKTGRSRTAVAAMIIFALIWLGQEAVAGKSFSFYMARNLLYERSDSLKAANANVESKDETRKSLKFLGGPTISAQAFEIYGETKIDIDKSVPTPLGSMPVRIDERYDFSGPRASISGTWPIFTGGKIQAAKKVSEFAVDEARAQRRAVSVELDTELIGKYFGLQLAVSLQKLREDMLRQQDRELARAIQFERQGMISHVERMGVQVARDAAERDYMKARDAQIIHFIFKHTRLARNRPELTWGGNEMPELLFADLFRGLLNWKIPDSSSIPFSGSSRLPHQDSDPGNKREAAPATHVHLLLQAKSF